MVLSLDEIIPQVVMCFSSLLDLAQLGVSATAAPVEIEKTKKKDPPKGIQLNLGEIE